MNHLGYWAIIVVVAIITIFVVSLGIDALNYTDNQTRAMKERPWAYGSADDAIKIIQTIREDPMRSDASSVHSGENAGSWYFSFGIIQFRGTAFVYNSFSDYRKVQAWLKKHPAQEKPGAPTW